MPWSNILRFDREAVKSAVTSMREIRLKISELFEVDARSGENMNDLVAITAVQVGQYCRYLADYQPAFYETPNPIGLRGCS